MLQACMAFSQSAIYALRVMAWLTHHRDARHASREIAGPTRVPEDYLSKLLRRLVVAELLDSKKGRGGGFTLARAPGEITVAQIFEAVDAMPRMGVCAFGYGRCDSEHPCSLHPVWARHVEQTDTWARSMTLADLGPRLEWAELQERLGHLSG